VPFPWVYKNINKTHSQFDFFMWHLQFLCKIWSFLEYRRTLYNHEISVVAKTHIHQKQAYKVSHSGQRELKTNKTDLLQVLGWKIT